MRAMLARARRLLARALRRPPMAAEPAYDLWSSSYDQQRDNPLLALDDEILTGLLGTVDLRAKVIADVGCGTGRHWTALLAREPARIVGYDVSSGMLARLRDKHPRATVHKLDGYALPETPDGSCDVLISTLVLGYVADLDAALGEWSRVLRSGGDMMLTDLHPDIAATGERCFHHRDRVVLIRHHVHSLGRLQQRAVAHGLEVVRIDERPLMYGAHFKKRSG